MKKLQYSTIKSCWFDMVSESLNSKETNEKLELVKEIIKLEDTNDIDEYTNVINLYNKFAKENSNELENFSMGKYMVDYIKKNHAIQTREDKKYLVLKLFSEVNGWNEVRKYIEYLDVYKKQNKNEVSKLNDDIITDITNRFEELEKNNFYVENLLPFYKDYIYTNLRKQIKVLKNKNNNIPTSFGEWLKEERLKRNYSLEKFGKLCVKDGEGISASYIYRLEKSVRQSPTQKIAEKLAIGLNLPKEVVMKKMNIIDEVDEKVEEFNLTENNKNLIKDILKFCFKYKEEGIQKLEDINEFNNLIKKLD